MCRERFHHYCSDEKNIIASFLKFAVYINNHKMLSGNIFGLILRTSHRKSLARNLLVWSDLTFGPLLQGQMRTAKLKSAYNSFIIGPKGLEW